MGPTSREPLLALSPLADRAIGGIGLIGDSAELLRAVRKTARQILPPLCFMIFFNYVDRTNLAYSYLKLSFVERVGLSATAYGTGSGLFYASYVIMQPIITFQLGKLKRPQVLLGSMNIAWGVLSMLFAFISSPQEFYALRVLLGLAEAICFPGAWYLASCFIPNRHLTVSLGLIELSIPLSMATSAPLALAIFQLDGLLSLRDWQWLFIAEAVPPLFVGLYMIFVLPSNPASLKGLTEEEHKQLLEHLPQQAASLHDDIKPDNWSVIRSLLKNWRLHYLSILTGIRQFAYAGLFFFLPVIVQSVVAEWVAVDKGKTAKTDNLALVITSLIWILCGCSLQIFSRLAQRFQAHRTVLGGLLLASGSFFCSLTFMNHMAPLTQLLLLVCAMMPQYSTMGITMTFTMAYAEGSTAAVGPGWFNAICSIFSIFGPIVLGVVKDATGSYAMAFLPFGVLVLVAGVMALFLPPTKYELQH